MKTVKTTSIRTTDGAAKSAAGKVFWVLAANAHAATGGVLTLRDTGAGGTAVWSVTLPAASQQFFLLKPPVEFSAAIYIDFAGSITPTATVGYE